jgi:hypothetical protein
MPKSQPDMEWMPFGDNGLASEWGLQVTDLAGKEVGEVRSVSIEHSSENTTTVTIKILFRNEELTKCRESTIKYDEPISQSCLRINELST